MNGDILTGLMLQGGGSALWPGRCSCGYLCGFFGDFLMGPSFLGDAYPSRGCSGNSLVVQWLRLGAFTAMARVWSLVWELKSHKLCGKKKEKKRCTAHSLVSACASFCLHNEAPPAPLFMIKFQTSRGQHFYHEFISTCMQASLSLICSLICTYFPDAVSLGFPRHAPSVFPSAENAWQSLSDAGVIGWPPNLLPCVGG